MFRIGCFLLALSLLAGGLGGLFEVEALESEADFDLAAAGTAPAEPELARAAVSSVAGSADGAALTRHPARPPPLR